MRADTPDADAARGGLAGPYEDLEVLLHDDVAVVRLNRPHRRNAMRLRMREELIACLLAAEADEAVVGIVVTGAGERAFSAGADLEELAARTPRTEMSRSAELRRELPRVVETLGKPTVAAINGVCVGAGLELALACTVRLASRSAELGLPEVDLGILTGSGGSQRLPRVVGLGWAMQMLTTGERIGAERAERIGLVTEVLEPDALVGRAVELARLIGRKPRLAFQAARDAVLRAFDTDLQTGIDYERKLFALCLGAPDKDAAVAAFLARRGGPARP